MSSLGGVDFRDFGIIILRGSKAPILPETKDSTVTVPGMTGVYDYGATLGARMIELECAFVGFRSPADLQQAVRRFAAHLVDEYGRPRVMPLRIDWEPDVEYMVRYSGSLAIERLASLGTFTLPLLAADPFAYAVVDDVFSFTAPGNYRFFRRGTAPSYPRIEIQGTSSGSGNAAITVELGGKAITYTGPLAAGETLVLDSDTLTAYRETGGGKVSAINDLDSLDFPVAAPGNNELILAVDGAATLKKATITCRSRWL